MKGTTIAGAIFMVLGVQGLAYGIFTYALQSNKSETAAAALASHMQQKITIPLGLGAAGVAIGGLLFLMGSRKPD